MPFASAVTPVLPLAAALAAQGALPRFQPGLRLNDGADLDKLAAMLAAFFGQGPGVQPLSVLLGQLQLAGLLYESATDGIVATPGGGQPGALQLSTEVNRVATVATAGDSVALPPALPGLTIVLVNHGSAAMGVFGAGADIINDVPAAQGVSQMPGSEVIFVCMSAGRWYASGLGVGYAGSLQTQSLAQALTARAGGGQASATPITAMVSRFTTVATGGDSAVLPVTVPAVSIGPLTIINAGVAALAVFPAGGDAIGAGAGGAPYAIPAGKVANFYSAGAGVWHVVLSA